MVKALESSLVEILESSLLEALESTMGNSEFGGTQQDFVGYSKPVVEIIDLKCKFFSEAPLQFKV